MKKRAVTSIDELFTGVLPKPSAESIPAGDLFGLLDRAGVRLMKLGGGSCTVGVWSDRDEAAVRAAIRAIVGDQAVVRYLDDGGVPAKYKVRCVPGEPVPPVVLRAMAQALAEPWIVRDRMLAEIGWNRIFETK
jgi:hypothetical protein